MLPSLIFLSRSHHVAGDGPLTGDTSEEKYINFGGVDRIGINFEWGREVGQEAGTGRTVVSEELSEAPGVSSRFGTDDRYCIKDGSEAGIFCCCEHGSRLPLSQVGVQRRGADQWLVLVLGFGV